MPILIAKVSGQSSPELTRQIHELLMDLTVNILEKKREITSVAIEYIPRETWSVGGALLSEQNKNSFYLNIKITDETNLKSQKAAYIAAVFAGFAKLLPNLHEESYIHVEDVRAASYGFGGKTQEYRYQHPDNIVN